MVGEQVAGLHDRQIKDVGNGVILVFDFQGGLVEPAALTGFAGNIDVGQKVHFHLDVPIAAAGLATPPFDVKGIASLLVTAHVRFRQLGEKITDEVKHFGIGGRIAAGGTADGLLIDIDDLVQVGQAL